MRRLPTDRRARNVAPMWTRLCALLCALLAFGCGGPDDKPDAGVNDAAQVDDALQADSGADASGGDSDDAGDASDIGAADTGPPPAKDGWLQWRWGGPYNDEAKALARAPDGGLWLAGYTESWGAGDWDGLILRTDSCGKISWAKAYGGDKKDVLDGVATASGGGAWGVGITYSFGQYVDAWVIRVDDTGALTWSGAYGGSGHDQAMAVTETTDGDPVVLGETYNFGPGTPDSHNLMLMRLSAKGGKVLWEQTLGGGKDGDAGFALLRTAAGGILVAGATESYGQGRDDVWLIALDPAGAIQWSRAIGGEEDDESRGIAPDGQGGYLVTGFSRTWTQGKSDVFVLRVDAAGEVSWMKSYGHAERERGYGAWPLPGGGFLALGHTQSYGDGDVDGLAMGLTPEGKVGWARLLRGKADDEIVATTQQPDGRVLWAGRTASYGAGQRDVWFGRIRVDGQSGCSEHLLSAGKVKVNDAVPLALSVSAVVAHGATRSDAPAKVTPLSTSAGSALCSPTSCPE